MPELTARLPGTPRFRAEVPWLPASKTVANTYMLYFTASFLQVSWRKGQTGFSVYQLLSEIMKMCSPPQIKEVYNGIKKLTFAWSVLYG